MELFAGIHIQNKPNEFVPLNNIDFDKNVSYLKKEIAGKIEFDAQNLELVYNGIALDDDQQLSAIIRPSGTVHCFKKTKKYAPYQPTEAATAAAATAQVQELFNATAHIQINVHSRVNILQKILAEYPEFRRNLGAQALIRDSVLFNTLHEPLVIKNIAEHYPIICEAAAFIVDTIKKELTRSNSNSNFSEPATDSTNSSEEENSLGASSSSGGRNSATGSGDAENARIRMISRQQLQAALQQIGLGSVNSLSNIAQRNSDTNSAANTTNSATTPTSAPAPLATSTSGDRISSTLFRNELQRALRSFGQIPTGNTTDNSPDADSTQQMDTTESGDNSLLGSQNAAVIEDGSSDGDIPARYRTYQYAEQLRTLAQMGFTNYQENTTYLDITNGNIENAINLIMGSMN